MIPLDQIQSFSQQIVDKFQPDRIILFGSYAYCLLSLLMLHRERDRSLLETSCDRFRSSGYNDSVGNQTKQ
jgi:hypothetical protein